jgi:glycosyltransferase involved in cell wall biosynthesis
LPSAAQNPKVSVIVPNYNHARFLRRRIDSILAQTFKDFELILLDDDSTDESLTILRGYACEPGIRLESNTVNSGSPFNQWNKGVRLARGRYIWIAESDDYADPRLLDRLVRLLDENSAIGLAYCRSWNVTEDGQVNGYVDSYLDYLDAHRWKADYIGDGESECRNYFVICNPIPNASAVVFRKTIYDGVGGADASLRACGDWKIWATMALTGKIAYLSEPLNYYRFHPATVRSKGTDHLAEILGLVHNMVKQFKPADNVLEQVYKTQAELWVPALMSMHVPLRTKRAVLKIVKALDPHPFHRVLRPALLTARLKIQRHWGNMLGMP